MIESRIKFAKKLLASGVPARQSRRLRSYTILSVCALLAVSGLIAAIIPARRAASIDPMP